MLKKYEYPDVRLEFLNNQINEYLRFDRPWARAKVKKEDRKHHQKPSCLREEFECPI